MSTGSRPKAGRLQPAKTIWQRMTSLPPPESPPPPLLLHPHPVPLPLTHSLASWEFRPAGPAAYCTATYRRVQYRHIPPRTVPPHTAAYSTATYRRVQYRHIPPRTVPPHTAAYSTATYRRVQYRHIPARTVPPHTAAAAGRVSDARAPSRPPSHVRPARWAEETNPTPPRAMTMDRPAAAKTPRGFRQTARQNKTLKKHCRNK